MPQTDDMETPTIPMPRTVRLDTLDADLDASLAALRVDPAAAVRSRGVVDAALRDGQAYYGINTGFGALARKRIPADALEELQRNLVLSHAVGVGPPIPPDVTRLMLRLKCHALGLGYSGVSPKTLERLLLFEARGWTPVVPSRGSLGASGDLAPLAHLALPLLGEGAFWTEDGTGQRPAADVLAEARLEPITLAPKDGLALINGTQMMAAYGAHALVRGRRLARTADVLAAVSLEALRGSIKPFDARVHAVRPHPAQAAVAENVRRLLAESEILESHRDCGKVQDPYSLRCVPQVHGASRHALDHAREVVETELNSVTDNPLVFPEGDPAVVSGGNFHGQPLALVLDYAAIALAELANISERRIYLLVEGYDELPPFLLEESGLHSGFMMPQYAAAALVSENKVLCHPASVDSIPSSRGQEDHVSMGSVAALKLQDVLRNAERVLAIELMTAAQALDYRRPLRPGRGVEAVHTLARGHVPHRERDELFGEAMDRCYALVTGGAVLEAAEAAAGPLR